MTDFVDSRPTGTKYNPPRAVRLGDAATGKGWCMDGPSGTNTAECKNGPGIGTSCMYGSTPH
jgi:hypothetical protein